MEKENSVEYIQKQELLMKLEYDFIKDFVTKRKEHKLTQKQLADEANTIRETVARIENLMTSPQLNTLIKLLEPMGYTIKIEPINEKNNINY